MTTSIGEDFPVQQARVRELAEVYRGLGPACGFALAMVTDALGQAERAMASGDIIDIVQAYERLRGCQ